MTKTKKTLPAEPVKEMFAPNLPKTKNKTFSLSFKDAKRNWILIDAEDLVLGRLAVVIADALRGKNKPEYTPNIDCGDNVVVINAEKVAVTGYKEINKIYYRHTGYVGGIKERSVKFVRNSKTPEFLIKNAVKGMLGSGPLAYKRMTHLHVYAGPNYEQVAQQPKVVDVAALSRKNSVASN